MGSNRLATLVAGWAIAGFGSTALAATYTSYGVTSSGYFDFVFVPVITGQAYELSVTAPGDIVSFSGEFQWSGNREAYLDDGSYDLIHSSNTHLYFPIDLSAYGNILTSSFVAPEPEDVYWPNGNIKYDFIAYGPTELLTVRGYVDPSFSGSQAIMTVTAVPEPATWLMMIAGFGVAGAALRRRLAFQG